MKDLLMVFDIQRFALHDGPGIRTTIFLKGCPLKCIWCHNPESQSSKPQVECIFNKCVGCGRCEEICPNGCHHIVDGKHELDFSHCTACGRCVDECLYSAMRYLGREMSPEYLITEVLKDEDFYHNSGGGLTVSGGEPLSQPSGLFELLRLAKESGLHVCLDTSGFAPESVVREIMSLTDLFLFDYKHFDNTMHMQLTGVSNDIILRNLNTLCTAGKSVWLRCPIIPGYNDTEDHFKAITNLANQYDAIKCVNIMAYHDMAKSKCRQQGRQYELEKMSSMSKDKKKEIEQKLRELGCVKIASN